MSKNSLITIEEISREMNFFSVFRSIVCIGDSLSSGEMEYYDAEGKHHGEDMFEYSWGQFIARKTGAKVYNFSRGGLNARSFLGDYAKKFDVWNKDFAAQAYIIALGVNDVWEDFPIGDVSDIDTDDYNKNGATFCGYYGKIIQKFREIQPRAPFFLVTMPREEGEKEVNLAKKAEHARLLHEMAKMFPHTYVIDLFDGVEQYGGVFYENYMMNEHLNPLGYMFTADLFIKMINRIIADNIKDFRETCFIGTDKYGYKYKKPEKK